MILLSDDSVLLIGGRGSPCRPNPHQYILKPVLDRKWVCSKVGTNEGVLGSYPGSCYGLLFASSCKMATGSGCLVLDGLHEVN